MYLSDLCIRRPVLTTVFSLIIIAIGTIFFTRLEVRNSPNVNFPMISVSASYSGADALFMERKVTQVIENELKTVKNLESISSSSSLGSSQITLLFDIDADIEIALNDVRSKVSEIIKYLPDDMDLPSVSKFDSDARPVFWISVNSSKYDKLELTRIAENKIKTPLEKLPSIGGVVVFGGRKYSMAIEPINTKMFQYKITPMELEQAIRSQNRDYPAGKIKTDSRNFSLQFNESVNKIEEFENIIIKTYDDGSIIKLKDIAKVELKTRESDVILRFNGKNSLAVGLIKQSTSNVLDLSADARQELGKIIKNLPKGVEAKIAYDSALPVKASINSVYVTIIEAIIFVGIVTYIFLGSMRLVIIPLVTIPISLIGVFAVMYMLGFSINTFTLLAMVLAIGLVVDDAIVVLEDIFRHRDELGKTPMKASFDASEEIGFAIIAMTITLASVFLPVGFINSFIGKLFIEFAWTLAFCVLISGFVALTLTPMMTSRLIKPTKAKKPEILEKFEYFLINIVQAKYLHYLKLAFNNKKIFYSICFAFIMLLFLSITKIDKIFEPEEDNGFIIVSASGPEGLSSKESLKTVQKIESVLAKYDEIDGYFNIVDGENGFAYVMLKNWSLRSKKASEIKNELNAAFFKIPGMNIFAFLPQSIGGGRRGADKPVSFELMSSLEYDELDILSKKFMKEMEQYPMFKSIDRNFKASVPTLDISLNKEKAYKYGVNVEIVGKTVQYLIAGRSIGDFRIGTNIYDVLMRYALEDRNQPDDLKKIYIKNTKGEMLPLEVVTDIIETITVRSYKHYNNFRAIEISSDINDQNDLLKAKQIIEEIQGKILDPSNTKIEFKGKIDEMEESNSELLVTFAFALIFIFLVLSAQFESFADSILILMAVPFSITGGVLILWLSGNTLNIYSNIGLVTLIGLVTKNSIMIVEFTNQLREEGKKITEALLEACKLRLRPILMTSIATICGAIPLVIASGSGAAGRNSIGLVIVGGMIIGTIFTLFVIPVLYQTFKKEGKVVR